MGAAGGAGAGDDPDFAGASDGGAPDRGGSTSTPLGGDGVRPNEGGGGAAEIPGTLGIASVSPGNAATDVERGEPVEITFTGSLNPKTVTPTSVIVTGPAGAVPGTVTASGATATFTPDLPWSLLSDYTIEISTAVAGADGSSLDKTHLYSFQTRDGVFSKPERVSSASAINFSMTGTRSGYVGVYWQTNEATSSVQAAIYNPQAKKWGPAGSLEADTANAYSSPNLALNESGKAFATFDSATYTLVWTRYDGAQWGTAKAEPTRKNASVALALDGTAMAVWSENVGNESRVRAASLSPQNAWSTTATLQTKATTWGVKRYGDGFLALDDRDAGGVYSHVFNADTGWGTPLPITTGSVNYIHLDTLGAAALFTWNDPQGRVQASVFDGAVWVSSDLGPALGGTYASVGPTGSLATWLYQLNAYAAFYDAKTGWGDPIKLGATTAEDYGPAAAVDAAGNALAAWPNGSKIGWRRLPHGGGEWLDPQEIKDQDPGIVYSNVDSDGNVMIAWTNPLGVWASRFE